MPSCKLDHIVVAADTLEEGVTHVEERLGVTVPFGGRHPLMGTHNCLMQLGGTCFLEIVAIDPEAAPPSRPRWFDLDNPKTRERLKQGPRLHTWVCRTNDIAALVDSSITDPGKIEEGRRGDLVWQITIPQDGSMPLDGLFPTLIQWPQSLGPNGAAPKMPDLGITLEQLVLRTSDPQGLKSAIGSIGAAGLVEIEKIDEGMAPGLAACLAGPHGTVELT